MKKLLLFICLAYPFCVSAHLSNVAPTIVNYTEFRLNPLPVSMTFPDGYVFPDTVRDEARQTNQLKESIDTTAISIENNRIEVLGNTEKVLASSQNFNSLFEKGQNGDFLIKHGTGADWVAGERIVNTYLHKNTMQEMRSMSDQEKADIKNNNYKGVLLHGYYSYGDTPGVIAYYKSSTTQADDQGSIIQIDSNLKLEHKFLTCDVAYYGLQPEINTVSVVDRNTLVINNALKIASKVVITYSGKYWCRGNRGGEGGSYYRYNGDPAGITWWQVGDGNGSPGGINIPSNRTFEMGDKVTLKMRGTFMHAYNFITIWNKENVTIRGGNIIGDFDLDPALNEHKRDDGTFDEGQWGYGISLQGSKNVLIENVDISKMWADGINLSPDYLHNYVVNSKITIRNTKSHHNRRQGMSIDGGSQLSFVGCEFSDTKGQDPQSGVDLERDTDNSLVQLKDVLFIGCKFLNNMIGARTAHKPGDEISVKFDNCLFDGNVSWDYDSYTSSGVLFTNCKFAYKQSRFFSIELVGTRNHKFENCEFNNAIRTSTRVVDTVTYRCKNLYFENSKCLNLRYNSSNLYKFFDLSNSINIKIQHCNFESTSLQDDRILISADGAENIEVLNNTMRELGEIFVIKNVNGFKFSNNTVINTLRVTGIFKGNVKHFEMCRNQFSGNSYFSKNALAPVLYLDGAGTAFGKITDNVVYKDAIFTPISKPNSNGTGLYREYSNTSNNVVIANNKTFGFTNENAFQFNNASTNLSVSYFK